MVGVSVRVKRFGNPYEMNEMNYMVCFREGNCNLSSNQLKKVLIERFFTLLYMQRLILEWIIGLSDAKGRR